VKVIVAGSRWINNFAPVEYAIAAARVHWEFVDETIDEIVTGGAMGIDAIAKEIAVLGEIPHREFKADWLNYGKAAGPIRNRAMAEYADALILVWDGKSRGSANMLATAQQFKLRIFECLVSHEVAMRYVIAPHWRVCVG
jgi:hypothetical protein